MENETYVEHLARTESEGIPIDEETFKLHKKANKKLSDNLKILIKPEKTKDGYFHYKPKLLIYGKNILDEDDPVDITVNGKEFICTYSRETIWNIHTSFEHQMSETIKVFLQIDYNPRYEQRPHYISLFMYAQTEERNTMVPHMMFSSDKLQVDKENGQILEQVCKEFMEAFYKDINNTINLYLNFKEAVTIGLKEFNQ